MVFSAARGQSDGEYPDDESIASMKRACVVIADRRNGLFERIRGLLKEIHYAR